MDPKEIVRKGYNIVAEKYTSKRFDDLTEMNFLPEFANYIPKGGKVLDLGCGAGIPFTRYLSDRFNVTGIDISPKQIELACKNVPNATFLCEDMTNMNFLDAEFHGVLAYYSIIHVPRNEQKSLFQDIYRILKINGVILISLHSTDDPESIYDDFFDAKMYWSGFDAKTNIEILEKVGFHIIWTKLVDDSLGDSKHLFVFAQKQE